MRTDLQVRVLLLAGAAGGVLRIAAAFIPYASDSAGLEALYAAVDIGMMFGLIGLHLHAGSRTGVAGFVCFLLALAALASIVGPDATVLGVDFYRAGASAFALALAGYAIALIASRAHLTTAWLWLACTASGAVAAMTGSAVAFIVAGVALGLGFLIAATPQARRVQVPA